MSARKPSSLQAFLMLCLLAVGPLQAQVAYACAMMDTVVHDECCCAEHGDQPAIGNDCRNTACGSPPEAAQAPCCKVTVQVSVDQDARQHTPSVKPPDQRLDVDPPPALVASFAALFPAAPPPAPQSVSLDRLATPAGSDTYLVTLRLRI